MIFYKNGSPEKSGGFKNIHVAAEPMVVGCFHAFGFAVVFYIIHEESGFRGPSLCISNETRIDQI
jgi:hypothetical protein